MSLNTILSTAVTGLQTAQVGLNTVSNNLANINTPGYQREVINQTPLVIGGAGAGVTPGEIQVVASQYLQDASLSASADAGQAAVVSSLLDQAQSAFGDPNSATSYLNQLSTVFSDFAAAANNPTSNLARSQALGDLNTFLTTSQQIAGTLGGLVTQADGRISSDVTQINQLLSQINGLNSEITAAKASGADASGAQNSQNGLITTLSSLIGVNVATQANGAVVVRSQSGALLAGFGEAAQLGYTPSTSGQGALSITFPGGGTVPFASDSGELGGLLNLRNGQLPAIQAELAQYVNGAVSALNAAHNANTAAPPPQTLTGRNTGLDLPTIVGDFSGITNIAVVDSSGQLQRQVAIDFSAGTMSVGGGPATAFTPANFLTSLNTALGGAASASFANGALTLNAGAGSGIAIADDPNTPATDGGMGFSQFFGLNDLVSSGQISQFNTGLKASDANGFTPGGTITLQIVGADGAPLGQASVAVPAAPTVQDLVNALNDPASGIGLYGAFSLDANGALSFTPSTPGGASLSVVSDNTQRGPGGPSVSALFGIGNAKAAGLSSYQIRSDIAASPTNLALAKLNLAAGVGQPVVLPGDNGGALALAQAGNATTNFGTVGGIGATSTSIIQYGAQLAGDLAQRASIAQAASTTAQSVQTEASARLQSATGVNLDQELINLTTYQQAYSASAQLIQASKQMYNSLLGMMQ